MRVTYLGHACLMAEAGGRRLLMDPWLVDPAYLGSWWHYPPLELGLEDLGRIDYVWCSHEHPDHFDPKTLRRLPRETCFLVPAFTSGTLERRYRELGFERVVRLPFGEGVDLEGGLRVTCYRTDLVWEDSALVVEADGVAIFDQNDCKLADERLERIGASHALDVAFLPFSGAIQFPTCYEMPEERKRALCLERRRGHLEAFVQRARALRPRLAVPFAGNFCLPAPDQLWMNEVNNINTPDEAVAALLESGVAVEPLQMNPGDTWSAEEGHRRLRPAPSWGRRLDDVARISRERRAEIEALRAAEPAARPSLAEEVPRYFRRLAAQHEELPRRIAATVELVAEGQHGGVWTLRYGERGLDVRPGAADDWNLRLEVPAGVLQQLVDGEVIWDEALISFRLRFAENPEFFNETFWAMLYAPSPAFLEEAFRREAAASPSADVS